MSPKKQPQDSGSVPEEQWQLVGTYDRSITDKPHSWRLRMFRNQRGTYRTGLKCEWCGQVKVFSAREESEMDRRAGRGQY